MASKKSVIVVLKLSPAKLAAFPHTPASSTLSAPKSTSETPLPNITEPTPVADTPAESTVTPSAVNGASTPGSSLAPPPPGSKRKNPPAPRGTKRGAAALGPDGAAKPRGKPGPKSKKARIDDPNGKPAVPAHKLGPKANQGAINAGLRALDRTGKPCRKWAKRGFQVRSFTGVGWDVPTWRAPRNAAVFGEDVQSESTTSSNPNVKDGSSAVSERSGLPVSNIATPVPPQGMLNGGNGGGGGMPSSPAAVAAAS